MIKTPGSLQDLTQRIFGRGKAGAVGVGGVGPDDLVRVESLPAAPGRINLAVKRAGERSAGNRHAPFDVAGAGNGISHGFTAPVLDPTDVAGAGNGAPATLRSHRASPRPYQGQRAIRSLGVRTQGAGILGPKTRAGNRIRLPVSGVRRFCRGGVREALPMVRTARAVWSFDLRMHSRWSQSYVLSRKHTSFILRCAGNCNTLKYWSPRERLREWRSPY